VWRGIALGEQSREWLLKGERFRGGGYVAAVEHGAEQTIRALRRICAEAGSAIV